MPAESRPPSRAPATRALQRDWATVALFVDTSTQSARARKVRQLHQLCTLGHGSRDQCGMMQSVVSVQLLTSVKPETTNHACMCQKSARFSQLLETWPGPKLTIKSFRLDQKPCWATWKPFFNGKTHYVDWAIFNSELLNYQRVPTPLKNMKVSWDDDIPNWMEQ